MVTLTRSEAKTALNHVLDNVIGRDDSWFLKSSLVIEGNEDIFDFVTLTDDSIDTLVYEDINNTSVYLPVRKGDKMLVKCFLVYNQYLQNQSGGVQLWYYTPRQF